MGRERNINAREKYPSVASHMHPDWGPSLHPRHVRLGTCLESHWLCRTMPDQLNLAGQGQLDFYSISSLSTMFLVQLSSTNTSLF